MKQSWNHHQYEKCVSDILFVYYCSWLYCDNSIDICIFSPPLLYSIAYYFVSCMFLNFLCLFQFYRTENTFTITNIWHLNSIHFDILPIEQNQYLITYYLESLNTCPSNQLFQSFLADHHHWNLISTLMIAKYFMKKGSCLSLIVRIGIKC